MRTLTELHTFDRPGVYTAAGHRGCLTEDLDTDHLLRVYDDGLCVWVETWYCLTCGYNTTMRHVFRSTDDAWHRIRG